MTSPHDHAALLATLDAIDAAARERGFEGPADHLAQWLATKLATRTAAIHATADAVAKVAGEYAELFDSAADMLAAIAIRTGFEGEPQELPGFVVQLVDDLRAENGILATTVEQLTSQLNQARAEIRDRERNNPTD